MTQGLYWFGFEMPYFPFEDGVSVLLKPMCSKRWGVTSFSSGEWTGVLLRVSYLSYVGDPSPLLYLKVGPIYRGLLLCTEKSWWLESSCFISRGSPLPQLGYDAGSDWPLCWWVGFLCVMARQLGAIFPLEGCPWACQRACPAMPLRNGVESHRSWWWRAWVMQSYSPLTSLRARVIVPAGSGQEEKPGQLWRVRQWRWDLLSLLLSVRSEQN
jgi:hypothetical protein